MKTKYGLEFKVLEPKMIENFSGYDRTVAKCHVKNCGKIIVDALYEEPIDNEYDLEEIYPMVDCRLKD